MEYSLIVNIAMLVVLGLIANLMHNQRKEHLKMQSMLYQMSQIHQLISPVVFSLYRQMLKDQLADGDPKLTDGQDNTSQKTH